jgi:caa(3)-type oxidase subunit IV
MSTHHHPNYVKVWAILLVLLVVSVCGPLVGIKLVTLLTAFGIAIVKAYLVAKNFMHLNIERRYVVYLLSTCLSLMVLMFAGIAPDVMHHDGQRWTNYGAESAIRAALARGDEAAEAEPAHVPPGRWTAAAEFKATCAVCHGESGDGKGPAASGLTPKPADFTSHAFWLTRNEAHVEKVIREGGPSVGKSPLMVAFGPRYTREQITALAEYVTKLER